MSPPDGNEQPAHPAGRDAAAANEIAWLRRWLSDEAEGATTNDVLGLLVETTRDPALLTPAFLAGHHVVHPQDFLQYNRDRFELREDGGTWIIRHRDDGRIPLRVRRTAAGSWELIEPVIEPAALRATAAACEADELSAALGNVTVGAGTRQGAPPRLLGAGIGRLADVAIDDAPSGTRVEWSGGTFDRPALGSAVVDLLRAHAGLHLSDTLLRADAQTWRVWLARRGREPVATVGFATQAGHCALGWIVASSEVATAAGLLVEALREAAALEEAVTTSARVADRALEDALVGLGYHALDE